jgi:transcriptional regulator with XRE-family HTH domain
MGVTQPTVAAFEAHDSNPTLATLRRYALAVRASVSYTVEDADPEGRLTTVI